MRWKEKTETQTGVKRIKKGFIIFPKTIDGEVRCFEFAKWEEKYTYYTTVLGAVNYYWEPMRWIND